jgi:uncharacterized protein (TIGR04255 family)
MTSATLGSWRNPPLAYVVAELVISPYYSMQAAMPGLQNTLRSSYPRTVEAQEIVFDGGKPSAQPLWRLLSADQRHGVQLGTRSIALHATSYLHSEDFLSRWASVLDAIDAANLGAFVERAGLRYVDLIVPSGSRSPSDYLASGLKGVTPEGATPTGSMWAAGYQLDGCTVNMRTAAPAPKDLLLPPDFNPLPLEKPRVTVEAETRIRNELPIGFIDTDCLRDIQRLLVASELVGVYNEMQKLTSLTFKASLSEIAKGEWL